ncbi:MAG TPA: HAMP domain-containing sensor histidine kinase [Rhodocyclaceae bacterium]|nr:HAMP domain-containing sensor histidine kinase [Rhodocyclaceae bacterium]
MSLLDLSFRHKIPLWGSFLVIVTALAVSVTLMVQTYAELEEDLVIDTGTLARALTPQLFQAILRDDVWKGYEVVRTAFRDKDSPELAEKAENIIVIDNGLRVFVAALPMAARMQTLLPDLGPDYAVVAAQLKGDASDATSIISVPGSSHLYFHTPIAEERAKLGTLLVVIHKGTVLPRFLDIARYGVVAGTAILCILLPFNWYWGRRMAEPLVQLTQRMKEVGRQLPEKLDPTLYTHGDELGSLFEAYNKMLVELREKDELEKQVVHSDRLAALGQLAAGVAHEINNPLGGMLMAIDTLKSQTVTDARTAKTIALLERGLDQIKETVGALLVEAKLKSRNLSEGDIEDVLLLVLPQVHKKGLHLDWHNDVSGDINLPATLVRQVLINLLLNATHAAEAQGQVACHVHMDDGVLRIVVTNDGRLLSAEQMSHLFEPFSPLSEEGHGLGLWVSYQIAQQLGGSITASCKDGRMQFSVELPIRGAST